MPASNLTHEQLLARDTRDVSIGVSAGAGCGKTHVLTSRFLAHLDPAGGSDELIDLRQLIAITFTDAAAREMRSRIRQACYEKLDAPEISDDDRVTWQRLLREIDAARVSTIHSFCTALLRSNAADAGLDPTFGVLEQGEADVLLQEAVDTVLRERLARHDADVLDLAAEFGQLAQLKERLLILVGQRHRPVFWRWLSDASTVATKAEELVTIWRERYDRDAFGFALRKIVEKAPIDELLRLLPIATPTPSNKKFPAAIATLTDLLTRLQTTPTDLTPADTTAIEENARIQSICKKDDWPSPDDFSAYKSACEKMRNASRAAHRRRGTMPPHAPLP
jgi:ATP-dependent helicase/nuclease subunit A